MTPVTEEQWQDAVDAAHAMLSIEMARLFKLVEGGPYVNVERCMEILEDGLKRGVIPRALAVQRFNKSRNNGHELEQAIADMRSARLSHVHWAEHFEQHPEEEQRYVETGNWDSAEIHRIWVAKYDGVIRLLGEMQAGQGANSC